MPSILDRKFRYVPAASTNVAKTIEREKKRLVAERLAKEIAEREIEQEQADKVRRMNAVARRVA